MLLIACATLRARLPPRKGGAFFDITVFKDPAYTFITLGASVVMLGLYTPMVYLQEYAEQEGLGSTARLYGLSILSGASVFGRLIPNVRYLISAMVEGRGQRSLASPAERWQLGGDSKTGHPS